MLRKFNSFSNLFKGYYGAAILNHNRSSSAWNEVVGIALSNTGCNDTYPTVFLRISASLSWIESIVWPDEFKSDEFTTKSSIDQRVVRINVGTAFTIIILSVIFGIVVACVQMKRSRNNQEFNLNTQFRS